jgi:flagellin-specific chaperone FliS
MYLNHKIEEVLATKDVVKMFDDGVNNLNQALYYGSVSNNRLFFHHLNLTKGALLALSESVDRSDNTAKNLYNLLHFILYMIEDVSDNKDVRVLQDAIDILTPLRDALSRVS